MSYPFKRIFLFILVVSTFASGIAQDSNQTKKDTISRKFSVTPLPVVYYTPETRWAFGAVGFFSFRFKNQSQKARNSQFQLGGAYTQEKQSLFYLPYQLYWNNDNYYAFGELGYYKYTYNYWGIGGDTKDTAKENYGVDFPRIRLNFTKKIAKNFYAGLRYWYDGYDIQLKEKGRLLDKETVEGADGGIVSTFGIIGIFDNRDNYNFASKGEYIEFVAVQNGHFLGSDFTFSRFSLDLVKYFNPYKDQVLALNTYFVATLGNPPFNEMALMGGRRKMRGYYEGRYRDKNLIVLQGEYRVPLFWRIGVVGFGGIAEVAKQVDDFNLSNIKPSYGAGIRFALDQDDKINIRLDMGFGENTNGFYLVIGEAF